MKNLLISVLVAVIVCVSSFTANAQQAVEEKKAVAASDKWLELIDEEGYAESWEASAAALRNAVNKDWWEQQLSAVRKPLGKLIERKLLSARYMTSLPAAPDGEYVVIQYETSFENKKSAVETVTPMKEENGLWRVSGYYIKFK